MKVFFLISISMLLLVAGCQSSQLDDCKLENAELKQQITELEKQIDDSVKAMSILSEQIKKENK